MTNKDFLNTFQLNEVPMVCPKCHYNNIDIITENIFFHVKCKNCCLVGPAGNTQEDAVIKWNNRIDNENKCIFCGTKLNPDKSCPTCNSIVSSSTDNNTEYNCCYIDLLGFSNYTLKDDLKDCAELISNYATIFQHRSITDSFKSFSFFYPASDSIFIMSKEYNSFIQDISDFCNESLQMVLNNYIFPENKNDVAKVTVSVISSNGVKKEEKHWYSPIFSGGIAHGNILSFKQEAFFKKDSIQVPNFLGDALTKAVHIGEENHNERMHGARIFITPEIYSRLSESIKKKYIYYHEGVFDVLWPVDCFIDANSIKDNINNGISSMLHGMINFYNQYKNSKSLEAVYFNTCKLIYISLMRYLNYRNAEQNDFDLANNYIQNILEKNHLEYLLNDFKNPFIWR